MKLFDLAKVGCHCEAVTHSLEKRRGEDVKVLTLTLKVAPFSAQHATTMPDGVKPTLFKLNSGDPKETLRRVDFALGVERQQLHVFASPDTPDATFMLDQCRIHGTYARSQKDRNGFDFLFKCTFGPVGRDELEWIQAWLLTQKFVTFEPAEPSLELEGDGDADGDDDELTDADEKARRPAPMFDTAADGSPIDAATDDSQKEPARKPIRRHATSTAAAKAKQEAGRA